MAAVTSPTLPNTASAEKSTARPNGMPINSTGAGADPASNVTLRALVSTKEGLVLVCLILSCPWTHSSLDHSPISSEEFKQLTRPFSCPFHSRRYHRQRRKDRCRDQRTDRHQSWCLKSGPRCPRPNLQRQRWLGRCQQSQFPLIVYMP